MGRYTSNFVTSEEFEGIKNILGSKFKLEKNKSPHANVAESYDIIVSDGKFSMSYFQDKRMIIEGDQMHPQFDQVCLSADSFLGTHRKPIVKDSSEKHEGKHEQTIRLNKKTLTVTIIGVIAATIIGIISLIS